MDKELIKDEQTNERISEWMKCWIDKKFPAGNEYLDYSSWKKFFNFWNIVYPELPLKVAHTVYLIKLKEDKQMVGKQLSVNEEK